MNKLVEICFIAWLSVVFASRIALADEKAAAPLSLAGEWRFALDRGDVGVKEQWFDRQLSDHIQLPGILQAQGFGDEISTDTPWVAALPRDMRWYRLPQYQAYAKPGDVKMPYLSQPPRHYLGVAWYQREIDIPAEWKGRRVVLTLERPHWETTVYVDGKDLGSCYSLVAPHIYDLGLLSVGKHALSIRIDNRMVLPYRPDGHSVSDAEGAAWNGIAGKIELQSTTPVWIVDAQAFPDVSSKRVTIKVSVGNATGKPGQGRLTCGNSVASMTWDEKSCTGEIQVQLPADAKNWSEFDPALQHLTIALSGDGADDPRDLTFGLREIKTEGKHMLLNGALLDLRMTHDGGGFPLTGYPPTDVESWKRIIGICKTWGLNGMRFHSWCPPEAAFTAADEEGFYLQPECGMWNSFDAGGKMLEILNDETQRLLKAYGNHPSFILLAATNEPAGHYKEQLPLWDKKWREADPRRLYTDGVGRPAMPAAGQTFAADYLVTASLGGAGRARGPSGWFGADYESILHDVPIPVLGHEVGQWCAYPDFDVIQKFTGYLRPGNYEIWRDSAAAHGLLERNKALAHASGRFQLQCYKEEMEANLRTPSFSGIQLLDLHDYLGQGGALIGVLDAFWESKGYATPEEFTQFCNTTVPLARLRQRTYTSNETLRADLEVANFGPAPLKNLIPEWSIENQAGNVVASGAGAPMDIAIGKNIPLGQVSVDLSKLHSPASYRLVVRLNGTTFQNAWNFWVYPAQVDARVPDDVLVTSSWPEAQARLRDGGKVLFQPSPKELGSAHPKLSSTPIFWNRLMNPNGTWFLGLWCDAKHPALAEFPTQEYCDWQWIDLVHDARALNLDTLPRDLQPIVQPIDDWNRNWKLGLIYECKVDSGRLMVCSIDLGSARPGAASLRRSLLDYMASDQFHPSVSVLEERLTGVWQMEATTQPSQPQAPEVDAPSSLGPASRTTRPSK